jgi:hypothetical protein
MRSIPKILSKTKILRGFRCLKMSYLTVHHPELESPITPDKQDLFDQGVAVTVEARTLFPGGVLIDNDPWDFAGSLKKTKFHIENGNEVIFEAAFEYNGFYARVDVISYSKESKRWSIYEVKSSTRVKPEYLDDIALQVWIIAKSGLAIENIFIMHLNSECTFPHLENLFFFENVTEIMREKYPDVLPRLNEIREILQNDKVPNIDIGPYCLKPHECEFKNHCWSKISRPSIFELPRGEDKKWELYHQGIIDINDERITNLNPLQQRFIESHRTGERFVDCEGIKAAISQWVFPFIFLDFETVSPAIPRYLGCNPYFQVPFQFSAHIWRTENSEIEQKEFLHKDETDPRPSLVPILLDGCEEKGTIIAYYSKFESDRIKELAKFSPIYAEQLEVLCSRIVDLLPIIRDYVYDPKFMGSFSLKSVAPAILGQSYSYENMIIKSGTDAQRAFEEIISRETPSFRKEELIDAILKYCRKDTFVMVELVKWLFRISQ